MRVSRLDRQLANVKPYFSRYWWHRCVSCQDDVKYERMWCFRTGCGPATWWVYVCQKESCCPTKRDVIGRHKVPA